MKSIVVTCNTIDALKQPLWGVLEITHSGEVSCWSVRVTQISRNTFEVEFLMPDAPIEHLSSGSITKFFRDPKKKHSFLTRKE